MVRVGLVGCGTIGSRLALAIQRNYPRAARVVALHDTSCANAVRLQRQLRNVPPICTLRTLIRRSQLVIEAASVQAAGRAARAALGANRSIFVMSVGGLLLDQSWRRLVGRSRARLYVPSGALAGLDGVKGMALGRLRRVRLTTRKPPRSLADAPYVRRKRLDLLSLRRPCVVFEGSARSVVKAFPQNTNVAATLALACLPPGRIGLGRQVGGAADARVRVRVVADPAVRRNIHEVDVIGDCGRLHCRIESDPSRSNPKTSEQAVRSALASLGQILGPVTIGT